MSTNGFFDPGSFDFVERLEQRTDRIAAEAGAVLANGFFRSWPEKALYDFGWDVFGLVYLGREMTKNCERCPQTLEALEQVPAVISAVYTRLGPQAHIRPHVGYTNKVLRCHLGLVVPPKCVIRVGDDTRVLKKGRCVVFDDTVEHEAWNMSNSDRIVLIVDFIR